MRKEINVLWLDDNNDDGVLKMQRAFSDVLNNCGYKTNVVSANSYEDATSLINDKSRRIDFFVSDISLEENESGLNFLLDVRKSGKNKEYFILYSNNSKATIRKNIKEIINLDATSIDYLSNYYFFSTGSTFNDAFLRKEFNSSIDMALNRWNELTALRGEYASINTLFEWVTRKILGNLGETKYVDTPNKQTYDACISCLESKINRGVLICTLSIDCKEKCFDDWRDCKDDRNVLEHNVEKWDTNRLDFSISSPDLSKQFFESDVALYRKNLLEQAASIKKLIDNLLEENSSLSGLEAEQEYVDLSKGL